MRVQRSLTKIVVGGLIAGAVALGGTYVWGNNTSATVIDDSIDVLLATVGGEGTDIIDVTTDDTLSATVIDDSIDVLSASVGGGGEDIISDDASSATVEDGEGMVFAIGPDETLLAISTNGPHDSSLEL